jgi:hypothetical protein
MLWRVKFRPTGLLRTLQSAAKGAGTTAGVIWLPRRCGLCHAAVLVPPSAALPNYLRGLAVFPFPVTRARSMYAVARPTKIVIIH